MKIGARVFKTGLAVTLSIIISSLLIPDNSPSLAAIAAITTTMPTVRRSFDMFKRRILANTIGGIIAVVMLYLIGSNPITIGVATIITIAILNAFNLSDVLSLAGITTIIVMLSSNSNFVLIAIYRVLETIIGVIVSFFVNWLILPPRHDKPFYITLLNLTTEIHVYIRACLRRNASFTLLIQDLRWAQDEIKTLETLFDLMRKEVIFSKADQMNRARRLVIYRMMLRTSQTNVNLLKTLHDHDDVFHAFSKETHIKLRKRVEVLLGGHEQVLMKFSGRVSANEVRYLKPSKEFRLAFLEEIFNEARSNILDETIHEYDSHAVIRILASLYDYEETLSHLNHLIRIYKQRYEENIEQDEKLSIEH